MSRRCVLCFAALRADVEARRDGLAAPMEGHVVVRDPLERLERLFTRE